MTRLKSSLIKILEIVTQVIVQKLQLVLGFNSSEIKISHIKSILELSNLEDKSLRIIDGGANIGEFTDLIIKFVPKVELLCIEPQKSLIKVLEDKYRNENVRCLAVAIGAFRGTAQLFLENDGDRKASLAVKREGSLSEETEVRTLSEIASNQFPSGVDLIKLDLEGMDAIVLNKFFEQTSLSFPKVIILEVSYLSISTGYTSTKTYNMLRQAGYTRIFRISPLLGLIPIKFEEVKDYEGHTVNWVAILQ
jgi:FkbM family methyltransferase